MRHARAVLLNDLMLWTLAMLVLACGLFSFAAFADVAVPAVGSTLGPAAAPQSQLMTMFLQYLLPPILSVVALMVPILGKLLIDHLSTLSKTSKMAHVGLVFAEGANSVVAELNATLKPKLEAALADGVLTDKEKAELRDTAINALKNRLPAAMVGGAKDIFGPMFDSWVGGLVERAVVSAKANEAAAAPAP